MISEFQNQSTVQQGMNIKKVQIQLLTKTLKKTHEIGGPRPINDSPRSGFISQNKETFDGFANN